MSFGKQRWVILILPLLGVAFWFLVAFPFADRNESYIWITYLHNYSFSEIIQNSIPTIRSFRPLAQGFAWCLYHLSGGNGILIQLINFVLLCAAILMMISLINRDQLLLARFLYLLIGIIYFSVFYYMFNLHGIFYSPILLMIVFFLKAQENVLTNWKTWLSFSALMALFHPFILIFYAAYVTGWLIEKQQVDRNKIVLLAVISVVLWSVLEVILPFPVFSVIDFKNLAGTMRNVENHTIVKIFGCLLWFFTLMNKSRRQQIGMLAFIIVYFPMALIYDLSILFLLAFLVVLSLVLERKWSLAGLVAAAVCFPLAVGSGAPTKASIFIFLLPYLLLRSSPFSFQIKDRITAAISVMTLTGIITCAALIRNEIRIPVLSSLIRPVLVEKGKTYQLKEALILAQQQTPPRRIQFLQEKQVNIRDKGQPKERDNFPPTKQKELDVYQNYLLREREWNALPVWYVAFGRTMSLDTLKVVSDLHQPNCKPAYIYESTRPTP